MALRDDRVRLSVWASWLVVGVMGAIDSLYGRTQYLGDWISYLNVSRAVSNRDFHAIFDPMWSPGYPALVALFRTLFHRTAEGEWYAISLLNWLIFLLMYAAWRSLLRQLIRLAVPGPPRPARAAAEGHPAILVLATALFLAYGLCFDSVARVAPDMLVSTLFLAASAQFLRVLLRPGLRSALLLGAILGAGCWVKGVFLAFSCIFLATLALATLIKHLPWKSLVAAAMAWILVLAPFAAATSSAAGHFTLGVTGSLNYAFHVNQLPHNTNWLGGPPQYGAPEHHSIRLISDLPVFAFAEPFHTTYPPYNNLAYWYTGYRHFFSLSNQIWAIVADLVLLRVLIRHPIFFACAIALLAVLLRRQWRQSLLLAMRPAWFLFLPPLLGFAAYMLVHVEDRYLSPFLLVASLLPLLPLLDPGIASKRALILLLALLYPAGALAEILLSEGPTIKLALHRVDFRSDEQWRIAKAMPALGLLPGDPVALIDDARPTIRCSWAYTAGLRIAAQFGGLPEHEPTGQEMLRHPFQHSWQDIDYTAIYRSLPPERQAQVLEAFRLQGIRAVLAYSKPENDPRPGWIPIPGTGAWLYRFVR